MPLSNLVNIPSALSRLCSPFAYLPLRLSLSLFPPILLQVLKRPVTNEELLTPGAPYVKKTLTVSDPVGRQNVTLAVLLPPSDCLQLIAAWLQASRGTGGCRTKQNSFWLLQPS